MLYYIAHVFRDWLQDHGLGFMRVFNALTFQTTVAVPLSFLICLLVGRRLIPWLRTQKIGDNPEFDQDDINRIMEGKTGTPTMGGVMIIAAIGLTTILLADLRNFYVLMALVCLLWLGAVGAADDWLKLTAKRRGGGRQGLTSLEKLLFQIGLGLVLSYFTFRYGRNVPQATTLFFPFFRSDIYSVPLGLTVYLMLGTIILTGFSNAVNLTDGLDGLAAGTMGIASFAFILLSLIAGTVDWASYLIMPYVQASGQMAVIAGAIMGACLGFLWFNCSPATVFMGDTGSLALGGLIGYIAIVIRQEILLLLIGGIFVVEAASVMLQVGWFKLSRRLYGEPRRILRMAPLHHHFQKCGWHETQVVTRFWLVGAMLAAMALATVKLR